MKHIADPPDDMMIPDELRATHEALCAMARTVEPRPAFLDDLDARVQREAGSGATAAQLVTTGLMDEGTDRDDLLLAPMPGRDATGAMAKRPPPPRAIGRRRFLIGSVAATAAAAVAAFQRRRGTAPDITATQQARGVLVTGVMVAAAPPASTPGVGQPSNLDFADGLIGWGLWGSNPGDYTIGIDPSVTQGGFASAYLRANGPDPQGFGTLSRTSTPDLSRGSRLRMRATVKADAVENWAGLWMRVDGPQRRSLSFDNMQGRPITGTRDWQTYEIVLDVPSESTLLAFGILLAGKGGVWLSDVTFDIVGQDVPTTDTLALPSRVQNLDFEAGTAGWFLAGDKPQDYRIGSDATVLHGGKASASLKAMNDPLGGFGTLMQNAKADPYRGTRVRMSGWAKADNVADSAGLWMRVDGPDTGKTQRSLSFDNMQERPIKGTSDWTRYEIVLDVPPESVEIAFGILLQGTGEVWLDDVQFTVVSTDVPTTNTLT